MHGVDHAGGGTGAAQRVADVHHLGDAGFLAAQARGHQDAQQFFALQRIDGFTGEPATLIDAAGMGGGDFGGAGGADGELFGNGQGGNGLGGVQHGVLLWIALQNKI